MKLPFLKSLLDFTAIIDNINYLITLKEKDEKFDTTQLEAQIDQLVYQLYGLTEEEVAVVEGATS